MKKIAILIFLIVAIQSVYSQKVDWSKPIYKVPCCMMNDTITYTYSGDTTFVVQAKWSLKNIKTYVNGQLIAGNNGYRSYDDYEIIDSCTKYKYEGDTTIAKEFIKRILEEKIYIDGKITKKRHFASYNSYSSQSIYRYDSLGSLCTRINIEYIEKNIKSDTIQYTNKYDSQNRLVRIIGSDKTKIAIKYRKNRIKKISHTPKNRYRKISYYKDANYKNDTLIITHTREGNQFERIEYDSINRPVYMEIRKGGPIDGYTTSATYKYDDNIQTSEWFEIDCMWTEYVIYKKEE